MSHEGIVPAISRRLFVKGTVAASLAATQTRMSQAKADAAAEFRWDAVRTKAKPFLLRDVRLEESPFRDAQEGNRRWLHSLPADRLIHNFRINAGLPSSAEPLGGWEKPDCELRGHFTGHYLSAVALMYASTGDTALKEKADGMVRELAKCQKALGGGYLSAFPLSYWDRLKARQKVWAPYYTLHKIMAGLFDVHEHCANNQALEVVEGMAEWVDRWTDSIPESHMQDILNTEYGGMSEVLYNVAAVTRKTKYAEVAERFEQKKFFEPLAMRRDELKGLHANTNVPKVIGAARRYELTQEPRYANIAQFFWEDVTAARTYCTGGTSNDEHWLVEPFRLAAELGRSEDTNECCVAYNMLKLTDHLYQWTADARYFDYYERTLYNHRLGTIEPSTAGMMYFLPLRPGAWKVFNSEYDSFWCCTGTGVEEYSKLPGSIYYHDDDGVFVNLFIPSQLKWTERGVSITQKTKFPNEPKTTLSIRTEKPTEMALRIRIPSWTTAGANGAGANGMLNGKKLETFASPGSYLTISRTWNDGDELEMMFPMSLWSMPLPDDTSLQAVLYGPIVLAAEQGGEGFTRYQKDQELKQPLLPAPSITGSLRDPGSWLERDETPGLQFRTKGQQDALTARPLFEIANQRYAVYWRVSESRS